MTLRLNLACGGSRWAGFENSDINGADRRVDLEEYPYPYKAGSASVVMMSHALFMTSHGQPCHPNLRAIMGECHRILGPGGWLRIDDNPLRCYDGAETVDPGEAAAESGRGYPDALRITRSSLRRTLLDVGFALVVGVPQGETNIPCDPDIREQILGNRMGHVSFTVEAQR